MCDFQGEHDVQDKTNMTLLGKVYVIKLKNNML